ncbi:MAG: type IV pilin N-terminal domain-containing protein [Candidatus Thermoplasmatota archaeon]|nr:type IV pilin N-terminal domain-containing protein [Candidatus Thermoplasmatota archaeon]
MKRKSNHAVSEVLATVLLLGITIALFGFLNFIVFSFSFEPAAPSVNLIGSITEYQSTSTITIEHNGGESLDGATEIIMTIGSVAYKETLQDILDGTAQWTFLALNDDKNPGTWDFGETVEFSPEADLADTYIQTSVRDPSSNTLILSVILQQ